MANSDVAATLRGRLYRKPSEKKVDTSGFSNSKLEFEISNLEFQVPESREHEWIGFYPGGKRDSSIRVRQPLRFLGTARGHQQSHHFVVAAAVGHSRPAIERPAERRSSKSLVFDVDGSLVFQEQLDGIRVSAIRGPVQTGLAVMFQLCVQPDAFLQQKTDHAGGAKLAGPGKAGVHLFLRGAGLQAAIGMEETPDHIEPSDAGCSFKVEPRAAVGEKRCSPAATVSEAANHGSAPVALPRVLDDRPVIEQKLQELVLHSGIFGMAAGGGQTERGSAAAIDVRFHVDFGAGLEQRLRDLHRVPGSLLAVALNTIGGDVM